MPSQPAEGRILSPNPSQAFPRLERWGLGLILTLFLILGMIYSIVTPIFEVSDELWHYPFVKRLADGQGLPVQRSDQLGPWRQEGSQPPLYYALGALLTAWIDTGDMDTVRQINPHADMGVPTQDRNVNMVVHTPAERWPYRGTVLAVHLVRWLSVLMGAGTVWAGYRLARALFPTETGLALAATAITAFNPMFLFITASVNNDALVTMLCALALWLVVRAVTRRSGIAQWGLLGSIVGLAALTKASALGLLPLAALATLVVARRERSWRALWRAGLALGLPVLLIAGWWYLRNWRLYGDPSGLSAFVAIVGARYPKPSALQLLGEWKGFVMSYWGFFGGVNVPAPGWVYWILSILGLAGLLGVPLAVWRAWRAGAWPREQRWPLALVVLWPIVVFVALIRWTLMTIASQGRLMFSALTALSLLMALGLAAWLPRRYRLVLPAAFSLALFGIATWLPWSTIRPAYATPPILQESQVTDLSERLDVTFGGQMRLLGYKLERSTLTPGESLPVTLYWQAIAPMHENYSVFVHLLGADELILGQRDLYPGQGNYPTRLWSPGEIIADTYVLRVSPTAMTPDEAQLEVGLYRLETGARLPAQGPDGAPMGDQVRFGRLTLPERVVDGIPNPLFLNLDQQIALVGYKLDRRAAAPGETLHLTLYWRALQDLTVNYSVFTHVLGEQQRIWAQQDGWPRGGDAPTSTWRKGQLIEDPYALTLAPDAPPGICELEIGLYDAQGRRLSLLGPGGHVQDTRIVLGKVRIR